MNQVEARRVGEEDQKYAATLVARRDLRNEEAGVERCAGIEVALPAYPLSFGSFPLLCPRRPPQEVPALRQMLGHPP